LTAAIAPVAGLTPAAATAFTAPAAGSRPAVAALPFLPALAFRSILPLARAGGLGRGPAQQGQDHRRRHQTFHVVPSAPRGLGAGPIAHPLYSISGLLHEPRLNDAATAREISMTAKPQDVLGFWTAAGPAKWFAKSDAFDDAIRLKFEPVHLAAARGKYDDWASDAEGALALLLLLDQFPRNLYRDSGHAFATDGKARAIAAAAVAAGHDKAVAPELRPFFYLPYEHAESLADQETSILLFEGLLKDTGDADSLKWAIAHRDIIARFGRFPHRNKALGRTATPAEQTFLDEDGFSG
jgi:uncharacterized protein (DUF924 family)